MLKQDKWTHVHHLIPPGKIKCEARSPRVDAPEGDKYRRRLLPSFEGTAHSGHLVVSWVVQGEFNASVVDLAVRNML